MQFREDIEGLRGLAVLVVVLFHIGAPGVSGGYVGVDVFFVISGYLISAQLIDRLESSGRIGFAAFWARRFTRLMPLLIVTVIATVAVGVVVYSPLFWGQLSREAIASTLYVSNIQFANDSSFYFQSASSPLLHTWSLSVEEQFYAAWPIVFGFVAACAARFRGRLRVWLFWAILGVSAVSFVLGLMLARRGSPWAFFSSPSRAWEFGFGALILSVQRRVAVSSGWVRTGAGGLGLAMVLVAVFMFDEFTEMPGIAALLPVSGTALVLMAGAAPQPGVPAMVLAVRPLRSLGRVSYAWYLFHWPAIVLVGAAMQASSRVAAGLAGLGSLGAAYLATWAIERPIRRSARLVRPRIILGVAGFAAALTVTGAVVVNQRAEQRLREPDLAALLAVREDRTETGSAQCFDQVLADGTSICVYGNPDADTTVLLIGDSHAAQWSPAIEAVAQQRSLRLVVRSRGGCPALPVYVAATGRDTASGPCLVFRAESQRLLAEVDPDLVVVANADFTSRLLSSPDGRFLDRPEALAAWGDAAAAFAAEVATLGSRLAVIEDNPSQTRDPIECLARGRSASWCSVAADPAVRSVEEIAAVEQAAFRSVAPVVVFRTAPLVCDVERCLVARDGLTVYSDSNHLSRAFVLGQTDEIDAFLRAALSDAQG